MDYEQEKTLKSLTSIAVSSRSSTGIGEPSVGVISPALSRAL